MTVPGPSVRTIAVDDNTGTAKDITALIVGDLGGVGAIEEILTELTGPADTAPKFLPSGFSRTEAVDVVRSIYALVGHAITAEDIQDTDNRLRSEQTMAQLIKNTTKDASARFLKP